MWNVVDDGQEPGKSYCDHHMYVQYKGNDNQI